MKIPLSQIERDESLQMRVKRHNRELAREYSEAMKRGVVFPAVVLFVDEQERYWIGDGWTRIAATDSLALSEIEADVRPGGRRAAFVHALGANDDHGARRTRADKLHAIQRALLDPEIRQQSNREIGRMCGVDDKTVAKERAKMPEGAIFDAQRRGRDGRIRRVPGKVRISAVGENIAPNSAFGGAGGGAFNVVREMREFEGLLLSEFERWPKDKQHAYCVALSNFAKLHDPEIAQRKQDAFDEMLTLEGQTRG